MDYTLIALISEEAILKMHAIFTAIGYEDYSPVTVQIRANGTIQVQKIITPPMY